MTISPPSDALVDNTAQSVAAGQPLKGGTVTWACLPGYPPAVIFPFTPAERFGARSLYEFQMLMYRPLYWFGKAGEPTVDYDLSIGEPPEWSDDGRTVTITIKPWKWSNGETICADNVMFWVNMLVVKGPRFGAYVPGYFPDNLVSYEKIADDKVRFVFDKAYSQRWVLMNQLSMITPMPRAWDRTADGPANASVDLADIPAVYDYLVAENGDFVAESNEHRTRWASSSVWSIVSGPWRLKSYALDGTVTFVPNEQYSGPNKPYLDEFRQVPTYSDEEEYAMLQRGPKGPAGIQVGFLPLSFSTEPATDPTQPGQNPLGEDYRMVPQAAFCIRYIPLNYSNPTVAGQIFRQRYFRQALQRTLDQDWAVQHIYQGYAYRQNGPIPAVPANDLVSPVQRGKPIPFDVEGARHLLATNGWDVSVFPAVCVDPGAGPGQAGPGIPSGTRLSVSLRYADGRPSLRRLMQKFKEDAARAGIELRLEEVYASVLLAEDAPCTPCAENPCLWELTCWNGGWVYYYPTGEILFKTGAGGNFGHYSDPRADELIARTVVSDDLNALYEYQDYIADQAPVIFTPNFPLRLFEVARNLRGFEPINPLGMITPENWHYVAD
jgi:peptide/nickel transport system substrate-binding protein